MNLLADFPQTPLTPEREQELLTKGDREAIVLHAVVPAFKYAQQGCRGRLSPGELLSLCYVALTKAVKNYKPNQQRFLSYARPYIRGELASEWRKKDTVRNAAKHETELPKDRLPEPLEDNSVEPDLDSLHWKEMWSQIEPIIRAKLTSREILVLELMFKARLNYREIGERLGGLSRSRVQQIQQAAILKIRRSIPEGLTL